MIQSAWPNFHKPIPVLRQTAFTAVTSRHSYEDTLSATYCMKVAESSRSQRSRVQLKLILASE